MGGVFKKYEGIRNYAHPDHLGTSTEFLAANAFPPRKSAVPGLKPLHAYGTRAFYQVKVPVNAEARSVRGAVPRLHPWGGR